MRQGPTASDQTLQGLFTAAGLQDLLLDEPNEPILLPWFSKDQLFNVFLIKLDRLFNILDLLKHNDLDSINQLFKGLNQFLKTNIEVYRHFSFE